MNQTGGGAVKGAMQFGGEARPLWRSIARGARSACPNCGEGNVFAARLDIADQCPACGEALHHHRADDLPAYLNILLVGHAVVGLMMVVMTFGFLSLWPITFLTVAIAVALSVALMRPLKAMVVAAQWALNMHGFGGHDD